MTRKVNTCISKMLYDKIMEEKNRLKTRELKRVKSRRKKITVITATISIAKRLK